MPWPRVFNFGSVPLTGSAPLLWCTLAFGWSYVTFEVRLAAVIVPSPLRGSFLLVFQEMVAVYVPTGLRAYPTCRVLPSGTSSDPLANRGCVPSGSTSPCRARSVPAVSDCVRSCRRERLVSWRARSARRSVFVISRFRSRPSGRAVANAPLRPRLAPSSLPRCSQTARVVSCDSMACSRSGDWADLGSATGVGLWAYYCVIPATGFRRTSVGYFSRINPALVQGEQLWRHVDSHSRACRGANPVTGAVLSWPPLVPHSVWQSLSSLPNGTRC